MALDPTARHSAPRKNRAGWLPLGVDSHDRSDQLQHDVPISQQREPGVVLPTGLALLGGLVLLAGFGVLHHEVFS